MKDQERAFKGVWIPKEVWLNKELTWMEKLFIVEIDSLDNDDGCFAGNSYFSDFFQLSKQRCSQIINSLVEKKYLEIEFEYKGKEIKKRTLHTSDRYKEYLTGCQEIAKENNTYNNSILKNTILDSNESSNDSLKKKKAVIEKKTKEEIVLNKKQLECDKFFDYWNDNTLTTKHKKGTKLHKECLDFFRRLKSGTVTRHYSFIDTVFYKKKAIRNKQFTDDEIFKTLSNMLKNQIEGYEPKTKDKMPFDLKSLLFNPGTGYSWFLNAYFNPPKKIQFEQKKKTSSNENLYNIIRGFFNNLSIQEENNLIDYTEGMFKKIDKLYEKVDPYVKHTNFRTYMGSRENPEPLIKSLIAYHKENNEERILGKFDIKNRTWRNFLNEMGRVHDCWLDPDEKRMDYIKLDYDNFQRRKQAR